MGRENFGKFLRICAVGFYAFSITLWFGSLGAGGVLILTSAEQEVPLCCSANDHASGGAGERACVVRDQY